MSVTIRTCLVITCSRCGQVNDDYDNIHIGLHTDSINDVRDWFTDWQWSGPNTPDLCPDCVAILACAREGHLWAPWAPWPTSGTPTRRGEGVRFRTCERCHDFERHPAPTTADLNPLSPAH